MTADRLADLLAGELEVRHGSTRDWGAWIATALRAALADGTLTPDDLGMECNAEGHTTLVFSDDGTPPEVWHDPDDGPCEWRLP